MKRRIQRGVLCLVCCLEIAILTGYSKSTGPDKTVLMAAPVVHINVELVEIIARLAEIPSHSTDNHSKDRNPHYVAAMEAYFAPYKDHPAVGYMRYLAKERHISYNAVPGIAPFLTAAPELEPRVSFFEQLPNSRWVAEEAYEFVKLMADFYTDTDCRNFFDSQQDRYARVVEGMIPVYQKLDVEWFTRFFGTTDLDAGFYPIIAPGQGEFNYGGPAITFPQGREEVYAIMASIRYDSLGNPLKVDTATHISLLVHEFSHSFVNPIQHLHADILRKGGEQLFPYVEQTMARQAYGHWTSVLNESLVRACEVRYLMAHGADSASVSKKINEQVKRGFFWMPELVDLLDEYEEDREKYPTMEHFIPRMAELYESTAKAFS